MIYVVPSLKAKEKLQCEGKAWAESQGFAYVPRGKRTIQDLMDEYGEDFLVYSSRGPQIDRPEGSHFFSLNMAELRIQNLRKGQRDHLLEALMGVKEYDLRPAAAQPPISVLDCTCGFGADAAELLHITKTCHTNDQRGEYHRYDHHLDEIDEHRTNWCNPPFDERQTVRSHDQSDNNGQNQ